tara:strand:- start:138 stop:1337 length:1200 start_codon:yes stop_codon:yes gene_type:complete
MSKYRSTWHLNEFTLVHTVRYLDPKNGKRFAAPYKTKEKAQAKMDQLKRDGVKDIEITQDTLRGNIKFKEVNEEKFEVTGEVDYFGAPNPKDFEVTVSAKDAAEAKQKVMDKYQKGKKRVSSVGISSVQKVVEETTPDQRIADLRTKQMMKQTQIRDLDPTKDADKITMKKNDIENIEIKMKAIRDKMRNEMFELIDESIKSDDDYQAKKKALQDIQNDPKMRDPETKAALMKRKEKLDKDYADFKSKDKIVASKEFEKDLAAEADLTKGQIKKVHKMADELPKKDFKDRYGKEKGDSVRYATATNIVKDKEGIKEMQQIDEKIKGIQTKSEKSGIPYGILKQVYNRGMAAWKGGHRPGTTPQQWAFARVNAFITKGKAYYTADADLAKKARAAKKGKK